MPWQRLRRTHVLKVRGLLGENYQPATANMKQLAESRGVALGDSPNTIRLRSNIRTFAA
jgi:hypothetical protein